MEPILSVQNLQTTFFTKAGALRALDGVTYRINEGETLGIVGESGCGKSVTSFSILGLLSHPGRVTGGKILFRGQSLLDLGEDGMRRIRGNRIAMIFQEPMTALNPVLTIGDQITEQIRAHDAMTRSRAHDRAVELLNLVGIPSPGRRIHDYPHQLSGGMRQRAMIAMALSCQPDLLIADEPTTALDVTIQAQILDLLQKLQDEFKMAMQFITHDLGVISELSDRVVVMYAGTIVEEASAETIFQNPRHPYTVGLMESLPRMDKSQMRLPTIAGSVPSLTALPQGCRFQNRCSQASEICRTMSPSLADMGPAGGGHRVACFHAHP